MPEKMPDVEHVVAMPDNVMAGYPGQQMPKSGFAKPTTRILIGTPTLGNVRMEWVMGRYGQIIPCNWSNGTILQFLASNSPMGYLVADAQNLIVKSAVEEDYEWLLLIEDDTIPPPDAFIRINEWMKRGDVPVVSGLYYTKSMPPEPLVYRGRGTSYFDDFVLGDEVWADGVPTGFWLCHMDVLRLMWEESEEYLIRDVKVRRIFEQPSDVWWDEEFGMVRTGTGTSDLAWCNRVVREDVLRRAGWPKIGRKKYPFLVDTNIFCRHISPDGRLYPPAGLIPNARKPEKPRRSKSTSTTA